MKPITAQQYANLETYIFDCIDFEGYKDCTFKTISGTEKSYNNLVSNSDKLEALVQTFKNEYWYEQNQQYYKHNTINGFASWLQGLPSCFNIAFENYEILKIAKLWNFDVTNEAKEDYFLENWWRMIAKSVFYLANNKTYKAVRTEQRNPKN